MADALAFLPPFLRPIYCITIRDERFQAFLKRLGPIWSMNVLKWSGTIGRIIDKRAWILKGKITSYCRLTLGQLGCFDSHRQLWRNCVRSNQNAFVVEDDVNMVGTNQEMAQSLETFWKRLDESKVEYDFVYIGHNNRHKPKSYVTNFADSPNVVVPAGCQGLFAYLVTPKGAACLLDGATPYDRPADVYVQHKLEKSNTFKCVAMYPSPFYVVEVESDTRAGTW